MTVSVAVNLVRYPAKSRRDVVQRATSDRIFLNFAAYFYCFPGEVDHFDTFYAVKPTMLMRDSIEEIGGHRTLPFITEMIGRILVSGGDSGEWIGVVNSDIYATQTLEDRLEDFGPDVHAVAVHRTDVDHLFEDPPTQAGILHNGVDSFFMRRHVWDEWIESFPDWVLGEPGWGQGAVKWCQLKGIPFKSLKGHETLHERHRAYWKTHMTPTKQHNQKLYRKVCVELGKKG